MADKGQDGAARVAELEAELDRAKASIASLQESNSQLNALLENTDDFILFSDERGAPKFWNSAYAAIMKELLDLDMQPGTKPHDLLEDEAVRAWWDGLHERVLSGEKFRVEFSLPVTPDEVRTFEVSFNPIAEDGQVSGFSEFTREITDRKRAESERAQLQQQLLQSQKMEALGKLAGGMAHDFNNLLAVMLGTSELLLALARLDDKDRARVRKIVKMAKRGRELTTKLLAFARREQIETRPTAVDDLVRDLLEMLESSAPKCVRIQTTLSQEPTTVNVAAGQVILALLNICLNACDAMPDGGLLELHTEVVSREAKQPKPGDPPELRPWCHFRITDTGAGIPPEIVDRMFEPFFTTKPRGSGTGLGLAVSQGIIESHGGWIDLTSSPHEGTAMDIYLPCLTANAHAPSPPERVSLAASSGCTILAVDDEPDFLETVTDQLQSLGHDVRAATGGAEAVEIFRRDPQAIDLVLLDILMPNMDGRATFVALQEIDASVRVVLCSGYSLRGQAEDMLASGAQAFLQKPFEFSDLEHVLARVLLPEQETP